MRDITLGQYFPGNSPIHRLDPRTKLLGMLAYIIVIFFVKKITIFLLPALFVAMVTYLARVPLSYLVRSLKPIRFLLVFMFFINLFMVKTGDLIWEWRFIQITEGGVYQAVYITLRLVLLLAGTSLMTLTTTPIALTDALEKLLTPFGKLGFPAHELAMMMTIALRFIPTLIEEADKIMKAQMARGADFESGNIFRRAKSMIPVLVPLFISAFRRADELAMAMESRCYHGGKGRTRMYVLRFAPRGLAAVLLVVAAVWSVQLAKDDTLAHLAEELNAFGYSLEGEDIYVLGESRGISIAEVLAGTDLTEAVAASRAAGFPSDVNAVGDIVAMLANTEAGVITLYLRNEAIELCFIQTDEGQVLPLGES